MCKLKSMILTKDGVFCPDYDSHSDMLVEMGIQDNKCVPDFVKIEITPPDGDMRTAPDKWAYTVDQDALPNWYVQGVDEPRCRKSLVEWYGAHVFTDGHHEVHGGKVWLYGNASAELYGNASAELYDNASATLHGNASAELYGNASAELYDNASATLHGNASAEPYDNASAELYDNASATLYNSASATLYGNASAELYGNASAELYDNASAKLYNSASAELYGNASAELYGNASAKLYNSASAKLYDQSVSIYRADYWSAPVIKTVKGECKNV